MTNIRKAATRDIPALLKMLAEINRLHYEGRPDLFRPGQKYNAAELDVLLRDPQHLTLVADDGEGGVAGYAICQVQDHRNNHVLAPVRTLYLDDLCVEDGRRGGGIGRKLMEAVKAEAKQMGCHNLTLNVWECNPKAQHFYETCGMKPMKTCMEMVLD